MKYKLWVDISRFGRIYPQIGPDGKKYLTFDVSSNQVKIEGVSGKLIYFKANVYASGNTWNLFKNKEIYKGKRIWIEGSFDEKFGKYGFLATKIEPECVELKKVEPVALMQSGFLKELEF